MSPDFFVAHVPDGTLIQASGALQRLPRPVLTGGSVRLEPYHGASLLGTNWDNGTTNDTA